jgi:hypothetical protein
MNRKERIIEARNMIKLYTEAEKAVLNNQRYEIGNRKLVRANLREIVASRKEWQSILDSLENGGAMRVRRVIPRDT